MATVVNCCAHEQHTPFCAWCGKRLRLECDNPLDWVDAHLMRGANQTEAMASRKEARLKREEDKGSSAWVADNAPFVVGQRERANLRANALAAFRELRMKVEE